MENVYSGLNVEPFADIAECTRDVNQWNNVDPIARYYGIANQNARCDSYDAFLTGLWFDASLDQRNNAQRVFDEIAEYCVSRIVARLLLVKSQRALNDDEIELLDFFWTPTELESME